MDRMVLARLHRELQARRDEILRRLIVVEQEGRAMNLENPRDSAEQSTDDYEKELLFQRGSSSRGRLQMINAALQSIHEGTFGQCLQCGGEINLKRLQAMPWTQFCLGCQQELEHADGLEFRAA